MLEKDWVGLQAEKVSRRHYPFGKVGCDVIGYLEPWTKPNIFKLPMSSVPLEDYLTSRERNENPFLPKALKLLKKSITDL